MVIFINWIIFGTMCAFHSSKICWFDAQETFLIIINVKNSAASYLETVQHFFFIFCGILSVFFLSNAHFIFKLSKT